MKQGTAFVLVRENFLAFGLAYKDGTFVISRGSNFRKTEAVGMLSYRLGYQKLRTHIIANGFVNPRKCEPNLVFGRSYKFRNISECSSVILGQSRSGNYWVNSIGESYPWWILNNRNASAPLRVGTTFKMNGTDYKLSKIVENQDVKKQFYNEYYLFNSRTKEYALVPELLVLREIGSIS